MIGDGKTVRFFIDPGDEFGKMRIIRIEFRFETKFAAWFPDGNNQVNISVSRMVTGFIATKHRDVGGGEERENRI